ncbi:putative axial regulator YABBY 2 [Smittium culicis]|uniref:Putative axial regulator YABBY 2 n=1 Tax=Smittium culicis TaxID=133412 RepID=A0A1R1YIM2_9FUNG|nr:putative axial regulator YABBY 2 [Smittium culicis]
MPPAKPARKGTRKLSAYNLFMRTELSRVKVTNPTVSHKDAFKLAALNWKSSEQNPLNAKTVAIKCTAVCLTRHTVSASSAFGTESIYFFERMSCRTISHSTIVVLLL